MAESGVRIAGLRELNAALAALPRNLAKNVLRGAVRAAAVVIRDEARLKAPVRTGQLRRALYLKHIPERSGATQQTFYVGVRQGKKLAVGRTYGTRGSKTRSERTSQDAFYARFLERGTVKMRARPFMRPAFDAKKREAADRIAQYIRTRLPLEAAKARRGGG